LNTRDLLQRRHWRVTEDYHCGLRPLRAHDDRIHLFFECNFSIRVRNYLQIDWIPHNDLQRVVEHAKINFAKLFLMEVLILEHLVDSEWEDF
jgi:hypothetical protein